MKEEELIFGEVELLTFVFFALTIHLKEHVSYFRIAFPFCLCVCVCVFVCICVHGRDIICDDCSFAVDQS